MDLRKLKDRLFTGGITVNTLLICSLLLIVIITLFVKAFGILDVAPLRVLLISSDWDPENPAGAKFGFLSIILGTLYVTLLAMSLAIPISVLSAIFIAEYAKGRLGVMFKSFMDVLASVPSVVFGMCAILVLVPLVRDYLAPLLGYTSTGFCVLTAGVTLALMVCPIIVSVCVEAISSVPNEVREASLSVGATKWQTVRSVVLRGSGAGIFSAILLGFGRAFGETMAVAMVVGNLVQISPDPFQPTTTLPTLIATNYGDMMSIPVYDSAIMTAASLLLVIVVVFNVLSRIVMNRAKRRWGDAS